MSETRATEKDAVTGPLLEILGLEQIGTGVFRGRSPAAAPPRVFGGQLLAQALTAASRTVPEDRTAHAAQIVFLRGADPGRPLDFHVEDLHDGRSFGVRQVAVRQDDRTACTVTVSFQDTEQGPEHAVTAPALPRPERWPTYARSLGPMAGRLGAIPDVVRPFDLRYDTEPPWAGAARGPGRPAHRAWLRAVERLPDTALVHQAALAYASDLTLVDSILLGHGVYWGLDPVVMVSLNHSVWFHRPFRADTWLLYDCESPTAARGRGLACGRFFDEDGRLVASVAQEALFRLDPRGHEGA